MTDMNRWGVAGCHDQIETITNWLVEHASRLHIKITHVAARRLVEFAVAKTAKKNCCAARTSEHNDR